MSSTENGGASPVAGGAPKRRWWQRGAAGREGTGPDASDELGRRVASALQEIRPLLQADGGDVELVGVTDDGVVRVRLQGACGGCAMSQITLSRGIEARLKQEIPEVVSVQSVSGDA